MSRASSVRARGYASATILIVVAIIGSTTLWSYREALTGRTLANVRLFQARAAALAGIGMQQAEARLRDQPEATLLSWQQQLGDLQDEQVFVSTRLLRTESLPLGFSADRFIDQHHEITSTATSGLGSRAVQSAGAALLTIAADRPAVPADGCPAAPTLKVRVQIGRARGPVAGLLLSGVEPTLKIIDPDTGQILWSAGAPGAQALQQLFDDHTRISTSLTVLDTDSDGLHDRIYAGDHAGRIWRVDLHNGNDAARFASSSVFAELADPAIPRALLAAPDASLAVDGTSGLAWLNIAIGTTGPSGVNRFYVLRDYAARQQWSDREHQRSRRLRDRDLEAGVPAPGLAAPGYYIDLGAAQVFTPSITIDGKVTYAVAATPVLPLNGCVTHIDIDSFNVADGASYQRIQRGETGAGNALHATLENRGPRDGHVRCLLAEATVSQCSGFDPYRRSWWRREDAD